MNYKMIFYITGSIMKLESVLMLLPLLVSFIYRDNEFWAFIIPATLLCAIGLGLSFKKPENSTLYARDGFVIVALSWIIISLFGAIPFIISGVTPNFVDAFFETVSGFTTTGSSILTNVEVVPHSVLFWRSFTHWVGGMGVLVFVLAFLPQSKSQYMYIMRAEVPGPVVGKLVSKIRVTARILYAIYLVMTLVLILLLVLGGMPVFDSLLHAFGTAGTGGFSIKNASIGYYNSAYIDYVISIFMVLFGINFNLFYFILLGKFAAAFSDEELRWYVGVILTAIGAITVNIMPLYNRNILKSFRYATFQVTSIITTTGYATADYTKWPFFSQLILVFLMVIGACAGSTGGGIKVKRLIILMKMGVTEIKKMLNPRSVSPLKVDKKATEVNILSGISAYFSAYVIILAASLLIVSYEAHAADTTVGAVFTCIGNVGPGLGEVGPAGNFSIFSNLSKLVLSFDMLAGRLELFPIIILFSPSTWRKV